MSIKFKSNIESEGKIIQSKHRAIRHTDTVQTLEVKVVTKTAAHPYHGSGSPYGYTIDGVEGAYLELTPGITYRFDQSDASNSGTGNNNQSHPLRFATAKDAVGSTAYTGSEVTTNGTPGSSGAYTQIAPTTSTPTILHYYCSAHNGMGSYAKFGTQSATDLTGFDTDDLAESSTNKYLTQTNLGQRSIGDLSDVNLTGVANNKILKYDSSTSKFIIADDGGSSSSSLTIQDEGVTSATAATTLDFRGSAVTVTGDNSATKTITISGTGGGGQVTTQKNISGDGTTEATDSSRRDFTITSAPASENNLQIYIDGVYQSKNDFSVSGTTVTLDVAPVTGAVVEIIHFIVVNANIFLQTHTATSGQTSFNAGGNISSENDTQVYIDGVYQSKNNYSASGSNVVFNTAPATGAVVEIVNIRASAAGNDVTSVNGLTGAVTLETGTDWQTGDKASNFTATAGKGYFVNTSSNEVTVTLPSGSVGDEIRFTDYGSSFNTNKINFTQSSGEKIMGAIHPGKCTVQNSLIELIYQDATKGWFGTNVVSAPPGDGHYPTAISLRSGGYTTSQRSSTHNPSFIGGYLRSGVYINPNGTKFFHVHEYSSNITYEATMSTAFDLSTLASSDNFDPPNSYAGDISFNPDGTKLFILTQSSNQLIEYTLSTAYDLSTRGTATSTTVHSGSQTIYGFKFVNAGNTLFGQNYSGTTLNLYKWNVSTAYDSTVIANAPNQSLTLTASTIGVNAVANYGCEFAEDGTQFIHGGMSGNTPLFTINFATAYDLSSTKTYNAVAHPGKLGALRVLDNGTRFVYGDESDAAFHMYNV